MSRMVRLFPVPSSLLPLPFGPFRFLLTTYAYPSATLTVLDEMSEFAAGLWPAKTGCAGSRRSTAVRVPEYDVVTYPHVPEVATEVAPESVVESLNEPVRMGLVAARA